MANNAGGRMAGAVGRTKTEETTPAPGGEKAGFKSKVAEAPKLKTVRLAIDLDEDFHRRLKVLAATLGKKQRDVVIDALKQTHPELRDDN